MKKYLIFLTFLSLVSMSSYAAEIDINVNNPSSADVKSFIANNLNENQKRSLDNYLNEFQKVNKDESQLVVSAINEIKSPILFELFPEYTFLNVPYNYVVPKEKMKYFSIPFGLHQTIGISEDGKRIYNFWSSGNREEFSIFLKDQKIKVSSLDIAKKILAALNTIYGMWHGDKIIVVDDSTWKLGCDVSEPRLISSFEEIKEEYFYLLKLSPDKTVLEGKLDVEVIERRKIK